MFLILETHKPNLAVDAANALGFRPGGTSILAPIGTPEYFSPQQIREKLKAARARGQIACLWAAPEQSFLDKGAVDLGGLAKHDTVTQLAELIEEHSAPCIVRPLFEAMNFCTGTNKRHYGTAGLYRDTWEAIVERLPAGLVVPTFCYEPSGGPGWEAWAPPSMVDGSRLVLGGVDIYGDDAVNPKTAKGSRVRWYLDWVTGLHQPRVILESGSVTGDIQDGATRVKKFFRPLHLLAAEYGVVALEVSNDHFGGYDGWSSGRWAPGDAFPKQDGAPPWPGSPEVVEYLRKKWEGPAVLKDTNPLTAVFGKAVA